MQGTIHHPQCTLEPGAWSFRGRLLQSFESHCRDNFTLCCEAVLLIPDGPCAVTLAQKWFGLAIEAIEQVSLEILSEDDRDNLEALETTMR